MKTASVDEMTSSFGTFLKASKRSPVVVTRDGKPVAVLVSMHEDDDVERLLMSYSPKLRAILDEAKQRIREGKGIPHDEFWAQVEAMTAAKEKEEKNGRAASGRDARAEKSAGGKRPPAARRRRVR